MEVFILAAGVGKRLQNSTPKPLTVLSNGESILSRQLRLIQNSFPSAIITLLIGYQKERFTQAFPHLRTIENPEYQIENTAGSLRRALENASKDVLFLNGDVVFHEDVLAKLSLCTASTGVVNKAPVGEEEVKYTLNQEGKIETLSKTVKGEGEALGIWYIKKEDLTELKIALRKTNPKEYFEKALEQCIKNGKSFCPLAVLQDQCIEIDFPKDLQIANELLKQWEYSTNSGK